MLSGQQSGQINFKPLYDKHHCQISKTVIHLSKFKESDFNDQINPTNEGYAHLKLKVRREKKDRMEFMLHRP